MARGERIEYLSTATSVPQLLGKEFAMKNLFTTKQLAVVIAILSFATLCLHGSATAQTEEGIANFYSDKFQGKKTASGAVYDKDKLTASHKTLPYGILKTARALSSRLTTG
jgi:rare lipoprotein A (peptidoglycan hydrolase)